MIRYVGQSMIIPLPHQIDDSFQQPTQQGRFGELGSPIGLVILRCDSPQN